jgi:hypothetical protein
MHGASPATGIRIGWWFGERKEIRNMNNPNINRRELLAVFGSLSLTALVRSETQDSETPHPGKGTKYAERVLSLKPVGFWRLQEKSGTVAHDSSPHQRHGVYHGHPGFQPPGPMRTDRSVEFDGKRTYVEIPSHADFSVRTHKHGMTVEAWMQPDRLVFPGEPKKEYLHWLGKGEPEREEWAFRFYSQTSSDRPNRLSAYIFNPSGSEGAGAYFQDASFWRGAKECQPWVHVVACYDPGTREDPKEGVSIYINGKLKQGPPAKGTLYRTYDIVPQAGDAPVRLGTRELKAFFHGRLAEVAIYPRVLTAEEIRENHAIASKE